MLFSQTPAWGWSSTKRNVGLFIVNPSIEYLNGSPVMVDYGGHIDVKPSLPADPTLLFIWHSPHYGGRAIQIKANERWRKIVGPFLLYCNAGRARKPCGRTRWSVPPRNKKLGPMLGPRPPATSTPRSGQRQRPARDPGSASSRRDRGRGLGGAGARCPMRRNSASGGPITIDWQTDGKHYQYWARADAAGRFTIPNARPGVYTLYAFTDGVLGEFSRAAFAWKRGRRRNSAS